MTTDDRPCCSPSRPSDGAPAASAGDRGAGPPAPPAALTALDGGTFTMGSDGPLSYPADGEAPVREVTVSPFEISPTAVTNAEFAAFVSATGHRTTAEQIGWSFVFGGLLADDFEPTRGVVGAEWWRQVFGADWAHPAGPQSSIDDLSDHPVVHVSWTDAAAYAEWRSCRLPTEAEWEFAARGGSDGPFPWGDELEPGGRHAMNVWQGDFPMTNTLDDGYLGTCPVDAFEPNGFGLLNMVGNVWEWTADWWSVHRESGAASDPTGPPAGEAKVHKGGSYLCHASYCARYRPAARVFSSIDSSTGNLGFRLAR